MAYNMRLTNKCILILALLVAFGCVFAGCSQEATPYQRNDEEGFSVSVKYDANGGIFTTNTSVIVDSYNVSQLPVDSDGKAQVALLSPDNAIRGNDAFAAFRNGYFMAGWYAQRIETQDETGNPTYVYADRWDFESDLLKIDTAGTYTASEPVLTLYAAWVPLFEVAFYDLDSGEYLSSYTFDPQNGGEILLPQWSVDTGAIEMYEFPERNGYTFNGAFYDAQGTQGINTETITHSGVVDYSSGTGKNTHMSVYVDWLEGNWYHIYSAEQFVDHASVNASFVLHNDLDFSEEIWPSSLMYGNFGGTIEGNGYTMRNISLEQTNNSKTNAGLFGNLTENAELSDVTFENVTFTIKAGARMAGTGYGLLAGTISSGAKLEGISIDTGMIQIDSGCYFGTDDYSIGLICGMGTSQIDASGITCAAVGNDPDKVKITVDGTDVNVEFLIG